MARGGGGSGVTVGDSRPPSDGVRAFHSGCLAPTTGAARYSRAWEWPSSNVTALHTTRTANATLTDDDWSPDASSGT